MNENITMRDAPSATALRSKRYRDRRKDGVRCFRIDLDGSHVNWLVETGLLPAERRGDPDAVKGAVMALCKAGCEALKAHGGTEAITPDQGRAREAPAGGAGCEWCGIDDGKSVPASVRGFGEFRVHPGRCWDLWQAWWKEQRGA